MNFKIEDYTNRLNLDDPLKKSEFQYLKNLETKQNQVSSFEELLKKETKTLEGKISSSKVRISNNYIKDEIKNDPYRKKLFQASGEFESIFVKMMLKEMKKTVDKNSLIHGGYAEEIFEDMLYDEYSKKISQNQSLGLAETIYKNSFQIFTKNTRNCLKFSIRYC